MKPSSGDNKRLKWLVIMWHLELLKFFLRVCSGSIELFVTSFCHFKSWEDVKVPVRAASHLQEGSTDPPKMTLSNIHNVTDDSTKGWFQMSNYPVSGNKNKEQRVSCFSRFSRKWKVILTWAQNRVKWPQKSVGREFSSATAWIQTIHTHTHTLLSVAVSHYQCWGAFRVPGCW